MTELSSHYLLRLKLLAEKVPAGGGHPYNLPAVRGLEELEFHPRVTFVVGENGSGKSTLLEAIAIAWGFNAEGGTRNFNFATRQSHSGLHDCLRLIRGFRRPKDGFFLRAESFYNVASNIDDVGVAGSYGGRSLHALSHGESFMALMNNRFGGNGLYILDEPEAALSPTRQLAMLGLIHRLCGEDSQFIIATHSPILMAYPDAAIFSIGTDGLEQVAYRDTEHYRVYRRFLNDPEGVLRGVLDED